jgi:hypothetical protein
MTTDTQQKAPGAANSKGLHTDTNASHFASHGPIQQAPDGNKITTALTAVYTRIKATVSGFYIDRGIGADTAVMIALALIYGYARVTA